MNFEGSTDVTSGSRTGQVECQKPDREEGLDQECDPWDFYEYFGPTARKEWTGFTGLTRYEGTHHLCVNPAYIENPFNSPDDVTEHTLHSAATFPLNLISLGTAMSFTTSTGARHLIVLIRQVPVLSSRQ